MIDLRDKSFVLHNSKDSWKIPLIEVGERWLKENEVDLD